MARTLLVAAPPALLIAVAWLRLEEPAASGADWLLVLALALAPALAPQRWLRLALVAPATLGALWLAHDAPRTDERAGFFPRVFDNFEDGSAQFFDVAVPFSPAERADMHGVVVLLIYAFAVVLAHAVAERRPLPAVLAVIAGAGWPGTLFPPSGVLYGALILAAALWVLAGMRVTNPTPALVAGAVLVLAAVGASTSAALAKEGVLAWENWDPNGRSRVPVGVDYVWQAAYGGIEFPKRKTTVLRITGPERGLYWRATTLDQFTADRWIENPTPLSTGLARGRLPDDPLLPARSLNPRTWIKQEVVVVALRDSHVVGAAQPVSLDAPAFGGVFRLAGGIVRVQDGLKRGQRYTLHSFAPRPGPAQLAKVAAAYPPALDRFLEIGRTRVAPFGTPGRDGAVDALFEDDRYAPLFAYEGLWQQAKRLRAGALTPYGAVVAIETWLRTTGGFAYDEQPPATGGAPPLAHFVADGRRGYCQHFAGAMALMLRFLGIPSRVAAGFTSGKREDGGWTVTDHNAHAWVEVWFDDYGWLPFDPTPGRGALTATYSASSTGFNAGDAADAFDRPAGASGRNGATELQSLLELKERLAERQGAGGSAEEGRSSLWLVLLAVLAVGAGIGLLKLGRRRLRYATRDPRRLAGAARSELVEFLLDQGVAVGASATPDDLRRVLHAELGADARPFADALAEARFGPPAAAANAAARARRELRKLLRVVRRRVGRPARLRGLVALRSLRA
jgi:hypothetical protein